uniref:uncharacterized protein LOC120337148 n=1 Tax=Styela clava TaxID=7725 RepID=UPI00193956E7|nr:uncharacterized protein LOC120337148 [Styela clava]
MSRVNSGAMSNIGKPSILNVKWEKNKIKVKWEEGKGAIRHVLKVESEGNIVLNEELTLTKKQTKQSYTFDMNEYCTYGKFLRFIIEATGEGKKFQQIEKEVLIGGDYAVKNVVAKKDDQNPKRNIIVLWQSPNTPPQSYKIKVQEVQQSWKGSEKLILVNEISAVKQTQTFYKFIELKTSTEYYFEVAPIYGNQTLDGSISNKIKTDKILDSKNAKVKVPVMKMGYAYDVKFKTSYIEIDTGKECFALKGYAFNTSRSKTKIHDCSWGNGVVTFSWDSVDGAKNIS